MRALLALFSGALVYFLGKKAFENVPSNPQPAIFPKPAADPAPPKTPVRDSVSVAEARAIVEDINRTVYKGWFTVAHVLAIIEIESSFRPFALNPEDGLDFSFGLMQIRESSARDRGYIGASEGLYDPRSNIALGMAHMKWSWDFLVRRGSSPSVPQWISSYNAGVGNTLKGFINTGYIRKWQIAKAKYQ